MNADQQTKREPDPEERFHSILEELNKIKEKYVEKEQVDWYKKDVQLSRFFFNLSSILIIILSVSLPYLATLEGFGRTTVLPLVALAVAGLTGLSAFFRWDASTKSHIQVQSQLEYWLSIWELRITEAKNEPDVKKATEMAVNATLQLLENAQKTSSAEVEEHFQSIRPPRAQQS